MKIKLNELGSAIASDPNEFYREFPEPDCARVVHACILARVGYDLDVSRANLLLSRGLGESNDG
jgi:hypothetical protein